MKTQNLHSPEFEKELYSEVSFLDKYGMFIIVLLLSITIYIASNYVLRESHSVNSINENTNYTSIKGKVYTLSITMIGNFYMFSKDCKLIIDNRHIPCSILAYSEDNQRNEIMITFVSSEELSSHQIESTKNGFVKVEFCVSYRTLIINPIKSLLFRNKKD